MPLTSERQRRPGLLNAPDRTLLPRICTLIAAVCTLALSASAPDARRQERGELVKAKPLISYTREQIDSLFTLAGLEELTPSSTECRRTR